MSVETDIISTFTLQQPSIHLKVPGGQSPVQTHASALFWAHANTHAHTLLHNRLWCHQRWYVYFPPTLRLAQGFILYTEISELITSSGWAYPRTYTEIVVLDALMLSWICIRQWFATHTEDYLWHTNSLSYTCREGHNSRNTHTQTRTHTYIYMVICTPHVEVFLLTQTC